MASKVEKVIGVEIVQQAVEDAKRNAYMNGIENAEFICADAEEAARDFENRKLNPDIILVDPPRKGCSAETIQSIVKMKPSRVVYVSCDPATLARDLAAFEQKGYQCERLKPVDMFPRTAHVECVVLMSRVKD